MLQRLRQISISSSLRGAFLTGALLTLIVSSVSLYSWHEQSSQIRYSLDEYFPRIHAAFLIEGNLNLVVDQLNEFLLAPNTTVRLQLRNQIIQHLDKIERLSQGLLPAERQQLGVILQDSRALLAELDRVLYNMFLVREKVGELAARIDWLHDDFTTELNSLVQDFTWQQGTLLDQIEARQGDARQYLKRAREVQNEQQQVYTLARIENQIVDDLRDRLNELKSGNDDGMLVETHIRYRWVSVSYLTARLPAASLPEQSIQASGSTAPIGGITCHASSPMPWPKTWCCLNSRSRGPVAKTPLRFSSRWPG